MVPASADLRNFEDEDGGSFTANGVERRILLIYHMRKGVVHGLKINQIQKTV